MSVVPVEKWLPQQQQRLKSFGASRSVDIHCHCLPGLDDGPTDLDESIALCRALAEDGITTVIATPHQLGSYDRINSAGTIRDGVHQLEVALAEHGIPLELYPGGDVRVDERLLNLLDADEIGTCADAGRHLLLELPHDLFVDPLPTIEHLKGLGIQAIMTHPERYRYLRGVNDRPREWVAAGALVQITAGSWLGDFGNRARDHAWRLLDDGLVSLVATDAHDAVRRPPRMTEIIQLFSEEVGRDVAQALALDNPFSVLKGNFIEPPAM